MTSPSRRIMLRGTIAAALAASFAAGGGVEAAPLSPADQALVAKAQAYLESIGQVKGRFEQTDPRGGTSTGDLYIKRPGKARFAYDAPKDLLIVSDGRAVSVYDRRLKTFNSYPLGSTPLALFLGGKIKLQGGANITAVTRFPNGFGVTARGGGQMRGWITLTFSDSPMRLTDWTVSNAQGSRTRVRITSLAPVGALDPGLFVLRNPMRPAPPR